MKLILVCLIPLSGMMCLENKLCKVESTDNQVLVDCRHLQLPFLPIGEIPVNVTDLLLDFNRIHSWNTEDFRNITHLKKLSLAYNEISSLKTESLVHLVSLEELDLRHNPMRVSAASIPHGTFSHNPHLRILKFPSGEIPGKAISHLTYLEELHIALDSPFLPPSLNGLSNLRVLGLSFGKIGAITSSFMDNIRNSSIEELMIIDSSVDSLDPDVFKDFRKLHTINLSCNKINAFQEMMQAFANLGTTPLTTLILDYTNVERPAILTQNDFCTDLGKKVRRLSLKSNGIVGAELAVIPCLSLDVLSGGYYNQPFITIPHVNGIGLQEAFFSLKVRTIDISYLYSLGQGFHGIYCNKDAPLSNADYFPPPLDSLPLVDANSTYPGESVSTDATMLPPSLEHVVADHFGMHSTTAYRVFPPALFNNSLKVLNWSYGQLFSTMPALGGLWQIQILDMSHNEFKSIPDETANSLNDYINLRYLNLSHNLLNEGSQDFEKTFAGLKELISLDLSSNGITFLHWNAFIHNTKLRELLLGNNNLQMNTTMNLSHNLHLQCLDLSGNTFQSLSDDLMNELDALAGSITVNLSRNPFVCDCKAISFLKWLKQTNVTIMEKDQLMCTHGKDSYPLLQYPLESLQEECALPDFTPLMKNLILGILVLAVIIMASMALSYKWRWHIRWYYYCLKRTYQKTQRTAPAFFEDGYDAYVIFVEATDASFIFQTLQPALESDDTRSCSLFLTGRDDIVGASICDNVVEGLEKSNRVLVVVTPDFSQNEMADFSLHMALVKGLKSIVILLKDYPDFSTMGATLRSLLKPNAGVPVLEWPEDQHGQRMVTSDLLDVILHDFHDFHAGQLQSNRMS